ncbi:MAG TPA: hypothetical protein VGR51_05875 [Thermoplasmata archaeon]|jgi:NO-binding membrane sensor protein with MHYT domain|nr:hypothetical protein [Thermoplasmata archaeon]
MLSRVRAFTPESGFQTWLIFGLFLGGVAIWGALGMLAGLWSVQGLPSNASFVFNSLSLTGAVLMFTAVGLSVPGILMRRKSRRKDIYFR